MEPGLLSRETGEQTPWTAAPSRAHSVMAGEELFASVDRSRAFCPATTARTMAAETTNAAARIQTFEWLEEGALGGYRGQGERNGGDDRVQLHHPCVHYIVSSLRSVSQTRLAGFSPAHGLRRKT